MAVGEGEGDAVGVGLGEALGLSVETGGWPCVGPQPTSRAAAAPTAQRREIIAQVYGVTIVPAIQARPSSPPCGYRRGPQRTPVAWFGQ